MHCSTLTGAPTEGQKEISMHKGKEKFPKAKTKPKRQSGLSAAAQVLKEANKPMGCKDLVEKMLAKGLWKSGGKTPAATIYSAILREIQTKGPQARFKKAGRGLFALKA